MVYIRTTKSKFSYTNEKLTIIPNISVNQDFFELMRRIDRVYKSGIRLGESKDKYVDKIRISQPADMSFASREVVSLRQKITGNNKLPTVFIETRHFGLFAPYGPMPIFITEHARNESLLNRNKAFEQFMNILSQRFAIFQYRSWAQLHVAVGHDKKDANSFQNHVDQLVGINENYSEYDIHIRKIRRAFAGVYFSDRMSLLQLQKILTYYFGIKIKISQRYPTWIEHKESSKFFLGKKLLGKKFFNVEHSVLIELGPFEDKSYQYYDRGEKKLNILMEICNDFVNYLLSFTVVLYVRTHPSWRESINNMRIGKNSWLKPKDTIFRRVVYSPNQKFYLDM